MIALLKIDKLILLYVACGTIASADLTDYPTSLDLKINEIVSVSPEKRDVSWITPEVRPQVIARLQEGLQDVEWHNWGMAGLVALEDADTINTLINQWRTLPGPGPERGNALDMLTKNAPTAVLLPLLSQYLDDTRIYIPGGGDTPNDLEWRYVAATEMNDVIYLRKEFPAATEVWSHKISRDPQKYVHMRPWWEHNKEKIFAGRFAEATWLPPPTHENSVRPAKERTSVPSATDSNEAMVDTSKSTQDPSTAKQSESSPWPLGFSLIAAALGLWWLVIKKRNSK